MGILDFNKKKDELGAKAEANTVSQGIACNRCTLMVEDAFEVKEKDGVVAMGIIHGEINVGDSVYLYHHTKDVCKAKVVDIEVGKGEHAKSACNQTVALKLGGFTTRNEVPKYAVISGIAPQKDVDVSQAVENPMLLGLSAEYGRFARDEQYLNTLIYAVAHAHFITPIKMDNQPEDNGDGTSTFTSDTTISFMGVSHPQMPGVNVLPLFTDWKALSMWENVFEKGEKKNTMILRFPDVVTITGSSYSGTVINPFGPVPVFMPSELIEHITTLEGYKREFGQK